MDSIVVTYHIQKKGCLILTFMKVQNNQTNEK